MKITREVFIPTVMILGGALLFRKHWKKEEATDVSSIGWDLFGLCIIQSIFADCTNIRIITRTKK